MTDQQDRVPFLGEADCFEMHLGDERQVASMALRLRSADAVRMAGATPWAL